MALRKFKRYARKQAKRLYGFAKKRYGTSGGLARLAKDVAVLKTAVNSEKKYFDRSGTHNPRISTYSAYSLWDNILPGNGTNQRTGDQIKVLWAQQRFTFEVNSTALSPASSIQCRVMLVMDREPRGDTPLTGNQLADFVLHDPANPITSFYETELNAMGDRFKVLRDVRFVIDNIQQKNKYLKMHIPLTKLYPTTKGLRVKYHTADGTNHYPDTSRLYALIMCDDPNATSITNVTDSSRVCYVDN